MSRAPCATTPLLATTGSPAVTGAKGASPAAQGNGEAVDFRGVVTGSEGVVWGQGRRRPARRRRNSAHRLRRYRRRGPVPVPARRRRRRVRLPALRETQEEAATSAEITAPNSRTGVQARPARARSDAEPSRGAW